MRGLSRCGIIRAHHQIKECPLESSNLAQTVVDLVVDKKAEDVVLLDIQGLSPIADYFVICSGATERQIAAIVEAVEATLKSLGRLPLHVEGAHSSGWVLMDYSDVIIHVFGPQERAYYQLERLWQDARLVVHIQ